MNRQILEHLRKHLDDVIGLTERSIKRKRGYENNPYISVEADTLESVLIDYRYIRETLAEALMSRIERQAVLMTNSDDDLFYSHDQSALVIDGDYALTFEEEGGVQTWTFREIAGQTRQGKPFVDLADCRRYEIEAEPMSDDDVAELLETNLINIVRIFAK